MLRRIFVITTFLILSALVLSCGGGSNPTTPDNEDESVNILGYSYPNFVPSLIAFSRELPNGNSYNNTNSELFVINPSGQFDHRLTFNAADDDFPAFNPGGHKVAFVSNRSSGGYGSHDIFWLGPVGNVVQLNP
jgi:Tol biopolymer transport system component